MKMFISESMVRFSLLEVEWKWKEVWIEVKWKSVEGWLELEWKSNESPTEKFIKSPSTGQ